MADSGLVLAPGATCGGKAVGIGPENGSRSRDERFCGDTVERLPKGRAS
jgi:hypothetical protein